MKRRHILSPYLFALTLFFVLLVILSEIAMASMCLPVEDHFATPLDMYVTIALFLIIDIAMFVVIFQHSYEYWGIVVFEKDFFKVKAPLRKTITMEYSAIADIGIDYSIVSGVRQFWMFFCKDTVPSKYTHRIARMPLTARSVRVQYTKKVYDSMMYYLPYDLRKRMQRASTVLRLFGIEK